MSKDLIYQMKFMLKHSLSHIIARRSAWIETIYEDIDLDLGRLDRAEERWRCQRPSLQRNFVYHRDSSAPSAVPYT